MESEIKLLERHFNNRNNYFKSESLTEKINLIKRNLGLRNITNTLYIIKVPSLYDYILYKTEHTDYDGDFDKFLKFFYDIELDKPTEEHKKYNNSLDRFLSPNLKSIFSDLEIDLDTFISTCKNDEDKKKIRTWGDLWNFIEKPSVTDYINMTLTDPTFISPDEYINNWYKDKLSNCNYRPFFDRENCESLGYVITDDIEFVVLLRWENDHVP